MKPRKLFRFLFGIFLIVAISQAFLQNVSAYNKNSCLADIKTKLGANSVEVTSITRECENISGNGYLGTMWFDTNSDNDYSGKTAGDTTTTSISLSNAYKTVYAHGFVVADDNHKNEAFGYTYATNIKLQVCSGTVNGNTCNTGWRTITSGISEIGDNPHLFSSDAKVTASEGHKPSGWSCSGNTCNVNGYMSRGKKEYGNNWSNGGYKSFKINPQIIKDTYFSGSTATNYTIYVYRCMAVTWGGGAIGSGTPEYLLGDCGIDPSTIKIQVTAQNYDYTAETNLYNDANQEISGQTITLPGTQSSVSIKYTHTINGNNTYKDKVSLKSSTTTNGTNPSSTTSISGQTYTNTKTISIQPGETKKFCAKAKFSPTKITVTNGLITDNGTAGFSNEKCVTFYRPVSADLSVSAKVSATMGGSTKTAEATADKNNPTKSKTASGKIVLNGTLSASSEHKISYSGSNEAFPRRISWNYSFDGTNKSKNFPSADSGSLSKNYTNTEIPLGTESYVISASTSVSGSTAVDGTLGGSALSATASVEVENPWNFDLKPTVSSDTNNNSYAGSGATAKFQVKNNKENPNIRITAPPSETKIQVTQIILKNNISSSTAEGLNLRGGDVFDSRFNICNFFSSRIGATNISSCDPTTDIPYTTSEFNKTFSTPTEIGDKICYAIAVNFAESGENEYTMASNTSEWSSWRTLWRVSDLNCGTTSKRPHFEVWGGSIYSAGKVAGATMRLYNPTDPNNYQTFGSWVDFGIIAKNEVEKVASGAAYAQGATWDPNPCDYSPLTITNTDCDNLGNSRINMNSKTLEKLYKEFTPQPNGISSTNSANLDANYSSYETKAFSKLDPNGKYRYTYSSGNLVINPDGPSTPLSYGTTHIIYAKGNITIENNLSYGDNVYHKSTDVPQYLIISDDGNINIDGNVERIDAWLIARQGIVDTCDGHDVGGGGNNAVSITNCNTKLEVNGPVFAKQIKLDRTAGADPSTAESAAKYAEKFDVGAASYLWAYNQALNYDQAKTVHLRELAPRY